MLYTSIFLWRCLQTSNLYQIPRDRKQVFTSVKIKCASCHEDQTEVPCCQHVRLPVQDDKGTNLTLL